MEDVLKWAISQGSYPIIFTAVLLLAVKWMAPRIDSLISRHCDLVDKLSKSVEQNTINNARLAEAQEVVVNFVRRVQYELSRQQTKLLIIEDNPIDQAMIRSAVIDLAHAEGLSVVSVSTLQDAVDIVGDARIIILDVLLPDSEYTTTARLFCRLCRCPVVLYTGLEDPGINFGETIVRKSQGSEALRDAVCRFVNSDRKQK